MDEFTTTLQSRVGKKLKIDLEAIPGAGYMWANTGIPAGLEIVSEKIMPTSKSIGGSSVQRFVIQACQPGSYSMMFELKRSWENQPIKTHVYSIEVTGKKMEER